MDRREMLAAVGSVGLGFTIRDGIVSAAEHGAHGAGAARGGPLAGQLRVDFPQSMDQIGRQWTTTGPDQPTFVRQ
jgi:hypothetical protein